MLFFVDESHQTIAGKKVGALGAIAIPEDRYNRFCGLVYRTKKEVLGAKALDECEIKGTTALGAGSFRREGNTRDAPGLEAVRRVLKALKEQAALVFAVPTDRPDLLTLRTRDAEYLTAPYTELLERFTKVVERKDRGILFFDQLGHREDRRASCAIQNYIARTRPADDHLRLGLIQVPHFTHSLVSPGLQAADLVAYLAAQQTTPGNRPELQEWWENFAALSANPSLCGALKKGEPAGQRP